jgi:hypothetical protein
MSKSRNKKSSGAASPPEASAAQQPSLAPSSGAPSRAPAAPAARRSSLDQRTGVTGISISSNRFAAFATPDDIYDVDDEPAPAKPTPQPAQHAGTSTPHAAAPDPTAVSRRRRRGGTNAADGGGDSAAAATQMEPARDPVRPAAAAPTTNGHAVAPPAVPAPKQAASEKAPSRRPAPAAAHSRHHKGVAGGPPTGSRRRRLWRVLQWPLAVLVVVLGYAAVPRRLMEVRLSSAWYGTAGVRHRGSSSRWYRVGGWYRNSGSASLASPYNNLCPSDVSPRMPYYRARLPYPTTHRPQPLPAPRSQLPLGRRRPSRFRSSFMTGCWGWGRSRASTSRCRNSCCRS